MFCPKCGKQLPDDSKFCEFCGAKIADTDKPKKGGAGLPIIIAVCALLIIVLTAGYFIFSGHLPGKGQPTATAVILPTETPVPTETALPEPTEAPTKVPPTPVPTAVVIPTEVKTDEKAAVAAALSTTKHAAAQDFEWLIDLTFFDGNGAGQVITRQGECIHIDGDSQPLLNGGWKAFMTDASGSYTNDYERYFNAEISTSGDDFDITMNWKYLYDGATGHSVEESGHDLFEGKWNGAAGTASAESNYGKVELEGFCILPDNSAEYAVGKFYWISGETNHIGLMRVLEP